jgi:hypothetical protein
MLLYLQVEHRRIQGIVLLDQVTGQSTSKKRK